MSDDKETPDWLMVHFKGDYDPCPFHPVGPFEDGLNISWITPAYVNPPYSNPKPWVMKAIEESHKGADVCMLLRVDPSTAWYRMLIEEGAHFFYSNPRFGFKNEGDSPNFVVMLVFLEGRAERAR